MFIVNLYRDFREILKGNILILFLTWMLLGFGNNMVHKFDGIYFSALGASDVLLGYMGAITFGMMAILQIPGGFIADRFGRKRVIVVFTFLMSFSILIFAFAPSWEYIVVGLVISNLTLLYQPALFSIVMDSLPPERRAEGFAITNLSSLPSLVAPAVGGALILYFGVIPGMRLGYFILFVFSLISAFMRLFLKETVSKKNTTDRKDFLAFFKMLKDLDPRSRVLIAAGSMVSASMGMVSYFVVIYASNYTSSLMFGIAMGISMLIYAVFGVIIGRRGDLIGKEKFYIAGILLISLSMAVFIFSHPLALFSYAVISGLGMAMYQPSSNGLIADLVDTDKRGRFAGVYLFISYLLTMVFAAIAGHLFRISPCILFTIASAISLIAGVISILLLLKPVKSRQFAI